MLFGTHPILSCRESIVLEEALLGNDEEATWTAMSRAGRLLGIAILRDFMEGRRMPQNPHLLLLAGKGHNAGDAFIAAHEILTAYPAGSVEVIFVLGLENMKPLVRRAFALLEQKTVRRYTPDEAEEVLNHTSFDLCIDGIFGMQFTPPLREPVSSLIERVNEMKISFRAAVDLPSGVGDFSTKLAFRSDFTYAAGTPKAPLFRKDNASFVGRIRYVDIGFFKKPFEKTRRGILTEEVLEPLRLPRKFHTDKRSYGHLFILAGSHSMPGALLMNIRAALRSGVGLVTAFVPEVLRHLTGSVPEAMWVFLPEGNEKAVIKEKLTKGTTLLMGSGLGKGVQRLVEELVSEVTLPVVLDADALWPSVIEGKRLTDSLILTPHLGEFKRMGGEDLVSFCRDHHLITVLKGPVTRISNGEELYYSPFGGPVLARGGSGDLLAGLLAGLLAQGGDALTVAAQAVAWHGLAADALARKKGHRVVCTTDWLSFLEEVL